MPGLWADGWFYISSAGLLVSGALFFFLLGQYRAAADAADEAHVDEPVETPATVPVRPVYIPDEPESSKPLPVAAAPAPAPAPVTVPVSPAPAPAPTPAPEKAKDALSTGSTTTGGISPAVVYLQNLKNQMDELGVELRGLSKKVAAVSDRDEALIERLAELTRAVEELKSAGVAAASAPEAPAPKRGRKAAPPPEPEPALTPAPAAEPAPAPAAEVQLAAPAPAAEAAPAPVPEPAAPAPELKIELGTTPGTGAPVAAAPSPDATMRVDDLKAALGQPAEEKAEDDKPRRGPVWPV